MDFPNFLNAAQEGKAVVAETGFGSKSAQITTEVLNCVPQTVHVSVFERPDGSLCDTQITEKGLVEMSREDFIKSFQNGGDMVRTVSTNCN